MFSIEDQVSNQLQNRVNCRALDLIQNQVGVTVRYKIWNRITDKVCNSAAGQVRNQVQKQVDKGLQDV